MWPFLWPLLQVFPQLGQVLFPFCRVTALASLCVDPLNRRVKRELRWFQVAAARGDVRVIQEQLDGVEIGPALQQPAAGLAPQVVHVEIHLPELLATAGEEPPVRAQVRPMGDRAESKRRPGLLIVLEALADFVPEHVRVRCELLAVRIVPPEFEHGPELLRKRQVPRAQSLRRPIRKVQLVEVPPQLFELHVEDLADATAGFQRRDDAEASEPIVFGQRPQPLLLARLEAPLTLKLAVLMNALGRTLLQVLPIDGPVEERLEPA